MKLPFTHLPLRQMDFVCEFELCANFLAILRRTFVAANKNIIKNKTNFSPLLNDRLKF